MPGKWCGFASRRWLCSWQLLVLRTTPSPVASSDSLGSLSHSLLQFGDSRDWRSSTLLALRAPVGMLIKLTAAKPLFPSSSSRLLASRYTPLHARHLASTHTPPRPAPPSSVRPRPSDISSASQSSQGDSAPQLKNPCPPPSPSSAPRLVRYDEAYYPYLSTPTSKALAAATATGSSSRIFGFRNSTASTSFENAARQERQAQVQAQAKAVKAAATQSLQALQKHEPDEMSKTKQESTVKASAVAEPQQHVKQRAAHSHAHSHGGHDHHHHEGSAEEAEKLLAALKGQGE